MAIPFQPFLPLFKEISAEKQTQKLQGKNGLQPLFFPNALWGIQIDNIKSTFEQLRLIAIHSD